MYKINQDDLYVRGFLLQPQSAAIKPELSGWSKKVFGTRSLLLHPKTEILSCTKETLIKATRPGFFVHEAATPK